MVIFMTSSLAQRTNSEVLVATLDLHDKKAVDVGCGEGHLVRLMTRHGAKAFGVDSSAQQLEQAHAQKPVGDEVYFEGCAEKLPFDSDSVDMVVFFNSLHHVAVDKMKTALQEAHRVLKTAGVLYVCEPVAEGPHFELMRPVHDETRVRAAAYKALQKSARLGFVPQNEFSYTHPALHEDFSTFKDRMLRINPHRVDDFAALEGDLQDAFERLGVVVTDGVSFDQPMRVNVFHKA